MMTDPFAIEVHADWLAERGLPDIGWRGVSETGPPPIGYGDGNVGGDGYGDGNGDGYGNSSGYGYGSI